jgi:hypothetical protein
MNEDNKKQYRSNAIGTASVGGATFGAGAYINRKAEDALRNSGKPGLWDATMKRKLGAEHVKFAGKKLGARSLQVTGLPLAAYGVKQIIKPTKNRQVDLSRDVIKPVTQNALLTDQVKRGEHRMSKADYNDEINRAKVNRSKQRAKRFSQVSGTLGLSALALRSPEAAAAISRQAAKTGKKVSPSLAKLGANPRLVKLASKEPQATKASNTLGIGAIGVGSAGSFNFARLQGLEVKRDKEKINKAMPKPSLKALKAIGEARFDRITLKRKKTAEQFLPEGKLIGERPLGVDDQGVKYTDLDKPYEVSYVNPTTDSKILDALGSRRFEFGVKGEGKSQVRGAIRVLPTGRIIPEGFTANKGSNRATAATIKEVTANAHRAKSPGITFRAAGYDKKANPGVGYTAWREIPGVGFVPGVGYGRSGLGVFAPRKKMNNYFPEGEKELSREDVRAMRMHVIRAAAGLAKPSDANKGLMTRGTPAHDYMKDMSWWGTVPGRTPFLGKTKIAAGVATGGGGMAYFEEQKHPRGQGGQFRSKGLVQKDAFLDQHRNRISPKAEEGYKHLRSGAKARNIDAGANAVLGAGIIGYSVRDLRHKNRLGAAVGTLGGALTLKNAAENASAARQWNAKANKIKERAYQRERDGEWGKGRQSTIAKSMWIEKGFPIKNGMAIGMPKPKGMMRRPSLRAGHLMRTSSGKTVTVRGSVG